MARCRSRSFPRFCGQTFTEAKDKELAQACVLAYNDWMVEEWCGDSGGALIPLIIIPLWDVELAAAEVRRNAARGCHAVCFSEIPPHLGLPSIHSGYWDPLFEACEETDTVVCMHIGSSSRMPATSGDAPVAVAATLSFNNAMASLADWLFSGKLVKFPNAEDRLLRGSDRLAAVRPRARRRRLARAPRLGRRAGHRSRAAVDVLPPSGLRLLLPRQARPGLARRASASTT